MKIKKRWDGSKQEKEFGWIRKKKEKKENKERERERAEERERKEKGVSDSL